MYSCYLFHLTLSETFEATFDSFVFLYLGQKVQNGVLTLECVASVTGK